MHRTLATDEQLLAYARQTATTVWHASGTCKMGHNDGSDAMAVGVRTWGAHYLRLPDADAELLKRKHRRTLYLTERLRLEH